MNKIEILVHNAARASTEIGVKVNPRDVAFIVSLFLQGIAEGPDEDTDDEDTVGPGINYVTQWLLMIADIVDDVKDVVTVGEKP